MNRILFLLLCALHVRCLGKTPGEAVEATLTPMYDIALTSGQVQDSVLKPASSAKPEQPFTCPDEVPLHYVSDARTKRDTLIIIFKREFRLGLYWKEQLMMLGGQRACFPIAMGATPEGPKTVRDHASTPEGWYTVASKRDIGSTLFYRALHVDYPNREDVERAFTQKLISTQTRKQLLAAIRAGRVPAQDTDMGGWIMIHGMGASPKNWTAGCVALDNESIDLIFPHVRVGDPILLVPWNEL